MEYGSKEELMEGFQKGILDRALAEDKRLYDEKNASIKENLDVSNFK